MCQHAFRNLQKSNPKFYRKINLNKLLNIYKDDILRLRINMETNFVDKLCFIIKLLLQRPTIIFGELRNKMIHLFNLPETLLNNNVRQLRKIISRLDMENKNIIVISEDT